METIQPLTKGGANAFFVDLWSRMKTVIQPDALAVNLIDYLVGTGTVVNEVFLGNWSRPLFNRQVKRFVQAVEGGYKLPGSLADQTLAFTFVLSYSCGLYTTNEDLDFSSPLCGVTFADHDNNRLLLVGQRSEDAYWFVITISPTGAISSGYFNYADVVIAQFVTFPHLLQGNPEMIDVLPTSPTVQTNSLTKQIKLFVDIASSINIDAYIEAVHVFANRTFNDAIVKLTDNSKTYNVDRTTLGAFSGYFNTAFKTNVGREVSIDPFYKKPFEAYLNYVDKGSNEILDITDFLANFSFATLIKDDYLSLELLRVLASGLSSLELKDDQAKDIINIVGGYVNAIDVKSLPASTPINAPVSPVIIPIKTSNAMTLLEIASFVKAVGAVASKSTDDPSRSIVDILVDLSLTQDKPLATLIPTLAAKMGVRLPKDFDAAILRYFKGISYLDPKVKIVEYIPHSSGLSMNFSYFEAVALAYILYYSAGYNFNDIIDSVTEYSGLTGRIFKTDNSYMMMIGRNPSYDQGSLVLRFEPTMADFAYEYDSAESVILNTPILPRVDRSLIDIDRKSRARKLKETIYSNIEGMKFEVYKFMMKQLLPALKGGFTDVILVIGSTEYSVDRTVVSFFSDWFYASLKEATGKVQIEGMDSKRFANYLAYLSGKPSDIEDISMFTANFIYAKQIQDSWLITWLWKLLYDQVDKLSVEQLDEYISLADL